MLVHTATPANRTQEAGDWVEGERETTAEPGTPFDCCLFLPLGTEEDSPLGGRGVRRPTLLMATEDRAGAPVAVSHKDELLVVAPELNVAEGREEDAEVRWVVSGDPQPFGPPGAEPIGRQVILSRVEETAPAFQET